MKTQAKTVESAGEVTPLEQLKQALPAPVVQELELSYTRRRDMATAYNEACAEIAEKAGVNKAVLKVWIKARIEDAAAQQRERADQLQLLFDEIGG